MSDPFVWAAIATKFALYLGVFTSAGTVFATLMFGLSATRSLACSCALIGIAASLFGFMLVAAELTGEPSGMFDVEMLGLLWTTPVGTALMIRVLGLVTLILGLWLGSIGLWVSALGGICALFSFAVVGHVTSASMPWLPALLFIHVICGALWVGILTPLKRLIRTGDLTAAAEVGHRFGRIAVVFVPLLILAGLGIAYVLIGSVHALFGTGFGQAVLAKIGLFTGLLGLAALNKTRFVPRMLNGDAQAAKHLSISISLEWLAVLAVFLVTAVLTTALDLPVLTQGHKG